MHVRFTVLSIHVCLFFVCFLKVMLKCDFQILSIKFLRNVNLFISFKYHLTETLSGDIE